MMDEREAVVTMWVVEVVVTVRMVEAMEQWDTELFCSEAELIDDEDGE